MTLRSTARRRRGRSCWPPSRGRSSSCWSLRRCHLAAYFRNRVRAAVVRGRSLASAVCATPGPDSEDVDHLLIRPSIEDDAPLCDAEPRRPREARRSRWRCARGPSDPACGGTSGQRGGPRSRLLDGAKVRRSRIAAAGSDSSGRASTCGCSSVLVIGSTEPPDCAYLAVRPAAFPLLTDVGGGPTKRSIDGHIRRASTEAQAQEGIQVLALAPIGWAYLPALRRTQVCHARSV